MKRLRARFWQTIYNLAAARVPVVERARLSPFGPPLDGGGSWSDAAATSELLRIAGWTRAEVDQLMPAIANSTTPVYPHAIKSLLASRNFVQ